MKKLTTTPHQSFNTRIKSNTTCVLLMTLKHGDWMVWNGVQTILLTGYWKKWSINTAYHIFTDSHWLLIRRRSRYILFFFLLHDWRRLVTSLTGWKACYKSGNHTIKSSLKVVTEDCDVEGGLLLWSVMFALENIRRDWQETRFIDHIRLISSGLSPLRVYTRTFTAAL